MRRYLGWFSLALILSWAAPVVAEEVSVEEAEAFVAASEGRLLEAWNERDQADWVYSTYITYDTARIAARASARTLALEAELAVAAARFNDLELPADLRRKLELLKTAGSAPAPADAALRDELAAVMAAMEGRYGSGRYCPEGAPKEECLDLGELSNLLAESRDPAELEEAWVGWRTISIPMRDEYRRFVELANRGARELGFADLGAMWRSKYDMPADAVPAELDRLWAEVRPLYEALHCYVRGRLAGTYGEELVRPGEPIPAHLLGNMWSQSWREIYPLVAPADSDPGYDLTERLRAAGLDEREMVRYGERFFTSLGFEPLPETFWERSLFTQPADRDVVCHPSAWTVDQGDDLRIKMCIEIDQEDFSTIHHELGHNFYQRAYMHQPLLFRDSANDGFHEALGDTIALSVTPAYLREIGLIEREPDPSSDIGLLLRMALEKVAFLPFGLLVDQWRWKVFSGEIAPEEYNTTWWELRESYQGVAPPVPRTEADFDPGAKYHVPANTPYTRYFLAQILQFQFHRALCAASGFEGPLNRCSIYGDREVGARLAEMMEMGQSRPWPDALEALTGERAMDAGAVLDYFAPLAAWLEEQNRESVCGW